MNDELKTVIAKALEDGDALSAGLAGFYAELALQAIKDAGYVIVPKEPTEAMIAEAPPIKLAWAWRGEDPVSDDDMADVYRSMITAPQREGGGK